MGILHRRNGALSGLDTSGFTVDELRELAGEILQQSIHGLSFSPYTPGQKPGDPIDEAQIRQRLLVIAPHVRWIRTFSCSEGNEQVPAIARDMGLKTLVGVWLDGDRDQNEVELANARRIVEAGHADMLGVGNEVLLRGDLEESELLGYIERAKAFPGTVPVGYVDAYYKFEDYPAIARACEVVFANCYPYWEGCPIEHALVYMKDMHRRAVRAAEGRPVIISETGWPNIGTPERGAIPSFENAIKYFIDTCRWAEEDALDLFYFSSFDETWKVEDEGDVGAYWGLWDQDGNPKYV